MPTISEFKSGLIVFCIKSEREGLIWGGGVCHRIFGVGIIKNLSTISVFILGLIIVNIYYILSIKSEKKSTTMDQFD